VGPEGPIDVTVTEVGPGVHEWLQLWHKERKHLVEVCRAALAAGVEQRRVEIIERQAEMLRTLVAGLADDLGLHGPARDGLFASAQRRFTSRTASFRRGRRDGLPAGLHR
jgi:hypothetical protein